MKQLKFLMVAFTLLMGVSFTSCLNDDAGESMYDGIGYVRTVMGSYFVDLYGNTYHPTMASVTEMEAQGFKMSGTDLAQIAFKLNMWKILRQLKLRVVLLLRRIIV